MKKEYYQSIQQYAGDHQTAQALGSALLQSYGMIVPSIAPELALLITNIQIPVITHLEAADYALAGGAQFHTAGVPKNRYDLSIQIIETDKKKLTGFSELLMATGGMTDCLAYEGRPGHYLEVHELKDCAITFDMKDFEAEGGSAVVRVQAQVKCNYYGINASLGGAATSGLIEGANSEINEMLGKAKNILNAVQAGNQLIKAVKGFF